MIYDHMVGPGVNLIENAKNHEAMEIKKMTEQIKRLYCHNK